MTPNIYNLETTVEILASVVDNEGVSVAPDLATLWIITPLGNTITVDKASMTLTDNVLSYSFEPLSTGWYSYECYIRDATGRKITKASGFTVVDH